MQSAFSYLITTAVKRQLTYRVANISGMVTNLSWGFFRAYLLLAVLSNRSDIAGFDRNQILFYVGFGQAWFVLIAAFTWWDLMKTIRSGEVIMDFCKPYDLYLLWMGRDLGRALTQFASRTVPTMVFFAVVFRVAITLDWRQWAAFAVSAVLAWLLSFSWRFLYNSVAFWTLDARGIGAIASSASLFFMGSIVPVAFFPPWLRQVAAFTPFPGMLNTPMELLSGVLRGSAVWRALAMQAVWTGVMVALARLVLVRGLKKVVVQGG